MCGIAGYWVTTDRLSQEEEIAAIRRMTRALVHRGPDDEGYFQEKTARIHIGQRRLSIIDLSPEGHQPMTSRSGRYVMSFNGEVYNHRRIRADLGLHASQFRGHSDTEVMLAAIEKWGIRGAVERFIGMFAFALWDRNEHTLTLVRDRLGIKPLYFGWTRHGFVFGSELKALREAPDFCNAIDRDSLALFLRHNCVPAPYSIYRDVYKLAPGTLFTVTSKVACTPTSLQDLARCYVTFWSARDVVECASIERETQNAQDQIDRLEALLLDAVALRMEADVPLGAFLSGGVDSSSIVALMQVQSRRPVKTFTIGFHESAFDEATYAKAVARHLGTDHTEMYVTPNDALEVIPRLPEIYDEPFSDSSQIPTLLLSQLARRHVIVSLSGDGGDELFAGYERYFRTRWLWSRIGTIPKSLRRVLAHSLRVAPGLWARGIAGAAPLLPRQFRFSNSRDKIGRLADALAMESPDVLYGKLVSHWADPTSVVIDSREPLTALTDPARRARLEDYTERMMYTDLVSYLPDDILTKVDRASMAVGLEARVPLLDHRVVEFAWQLPLSLKVHGAQGKWALRQILYKYVPPALIERPKQGFGVPIEHWLRGPLRDWGESLLNESRLRQEGFFDPEPIRAMWQNHVTGRVNEQYRLWDILMFQAWLERQGQRSGTALTANAAWKENMKCEI